MLSHVVYLNSEEDFFFIEKIKATEVVLGIKELSRFGKLSLEQLEDFSRRLKNKNISIVLDCDLLLNEMDAKPTYEFIQKLDFQFFDKVRVQDPGLLQWFFTHTEKPIQFIAETAYHNLISLKTIEDYLGSRLDRLILNLEIKKEVLQFFSQNLKTSLETLGFGRILLFHTPRKLLAPLVKDHDDEKKIQEVSNDFIEVLGESEESPHKGFPIF